MTVQASARQFLAETTRSLHEALHHDPVLSRLTAQDIQAEEYSRALGVLGAFMTAVEAARQQHALFEAFTLAPVVAAVTADLAPAAPPLADLTLSDRAELLGALYVAHGASFGRRVFRKSVMAALPHMPHSFVSLHTPAAQWQDLVAELETTGRDPQQRAALLRGAQAAFACVRQLCHAAALSPDPSRSESVSELDRLRAEVDRLTREKHTAEEALKARSDVLAILSHEVRTPLNVILGLLQLIELTATTDPKIRAHASTAIAAGQNLFEMLTNTLDAARLDAGGVALKPARTDLRALAQHWQNATEAALERRGKLDQVRVNLLLDDTLDQTYWLDGVRLSQIIGNLTDNAAKFVTQGAIEIEVQRRMASQRHMAFADIHIRDTGPGIAPEDRALVFERFAQVHPVKTHARDGSGLGLAISKEISALLGADLRIAEAAPDGFSIEFIVSLPLKGVEEPYEQPKTTPSSGRK